MRGCGSHADPFHDNQAGDAVDSAGGIGGIQAVLEQVSWFWQDLFKVYVPKVLGMMRDLPIPRTEYKDADIELVLENIDISSFDLNPAHVYIRNITDIDIRAPAVGEGASQTSVGSLTRVFAQGVQLSLREVSFWFKQKTSSVGPSEISGVLALTLPPQGVDIDVVVRAIPNSAEGLQERARRGAFTEVQRVDVKLSEDMALAIGESNHQVLASVLRPVITARVRAALQGALAENVRGAIEWADAVAWDVGGRAEVFGDAGLPRGPALVAGCWSELGKLAKGRSGLLKGWRATGTGLVKGAGNARADATFAMGAEPQVLGGEKRGPRGNFSESLKDKAKDAMPEDMDVEGATVEVGQRAREVAGEAKERVKEGVQKVRSFKDSVEVKAQEEKGRPGWESAAFDASA